MADNKHNSLPQILSVESLEMFKKFSKPIVLPVLIVIFLICLLAGLKIFEMIRFQAEMDSVEREWCDKFRPNLTYVVCSKEFSE